MNPYQKYKSEISLEQQKIYENYDKVFLPHHASKHQYFSHWCFERGYIFTKKHLGMKIHTTSDEYEPRPFDAAWTEVSTRVYCLSYNYFWQHWSNKLPKLIIKSKALDFCDACYIFCNHMKNKMVLLMAMMTTTRMMLLMDMEKIPMLSLMYNRRCKIHNIKKQSST